MKSPGRLTLLIASSALVLSMLACNASSGGTQEQGPNDTTGGQLQPSATPAPVNTDTPAPIPTSSAVTITVNHDSLSIRRGPTIYYDVLAYFTAGQTATASARNSDGSWLYIPIPSSPSVSGWVSAVTDYSTTTGDIQSLPVMNVDPPAAAYIRNCTFHPMLVQPGSLLLQNQLDKTNRIAHFAPGTYSAYDQNQEGHPKVFTVTLTEGDSVDINTDGLGNTYYCP